MPTYEYRCRKCGYEFERFQNISEKPVRKCPKCGGKVERIIGPGAGIIFKGSGFYVNDYKRKSEPVKPSGNKPKDSSKKNS